MHGFEARRHTPPIRGRGFDSFRGLPSSDLHRHSPAFAHDRAWQRGGLNAAEQLAKVLGHQAFSFRRLSRHIVQHVGYARTTLVPGFFNESLAALPIDCDIYEATVEVIDWHACTHVYIGCMHGRPQALEWLLGQRLLVVGTYVYYDDWRDTYVYIGCMHGMHMHGRREAGEGERKAHEELTRKHGIVWRAFAVPFAGLLQVVALDQPRHRASEWHKSSQI